MPEALNDRPILAKLNAHIQKYQGCTTKPLVTDIALYQQSVEEITRLAAENEQLRKHIEGYRQVRDVPLLKNYAPYRDLDKPTTENFDGAVDEMRRSGMSIDGDNAYKRDLLDSAVGAMVLGVQNRNQPPEGHWGWRFWDIGRAEGVQKEELVIALAKVTQCLTAALTGGEVSAVKAGVALIAADEALTKYAS